jgi:thymidylate synthase|tara:strand:- start:277 stop:1185 length:909 start_codon:yes stop_codon:yes gene_type:complete
MSNIEKQYQGILRKLVLYGKEKGDRTGTGTLSYFGDQIRHNMADGFPLLTTKKMAVKTMMTELKWFLKGDTNIKYLVDNNCHIWNGDAYKAYRRIPTNQLDERTFVHRIKTQDWFAKEWGELGPIYGKQWRDWQSQKFNVAKGEGYLLQIDQIHKLIVDIKNNPDSRRLMVSAWNVGEVEEVVLPPCHYGFQCYVQDGKLSLMWNQRSCDTFLGIPFNIASYATLLLLLCKETGLEAGELIGNLGDVHLYKNHVQQAKEQIVREPFPLPTIELSNVDILNGEWGYEIKGYEYHPTIKAPLSN